MPTIKTETQRFFSYCPHCGEKLQLHPIHNARELSCPNCGYILWLNSKPAVSAFLIKKGKVLLAKRAINPRKGYWDPFGGFLDFHEDPLKGLQRELREELSITISQATYLGIYLGEYGKNPTQSTFNVYYIVNSWKGKLKPQDDVASYRWFSINRIPKNLAFPYIKQAFRSLQKAFQKK